MSIFAKYVGQQSSGGGGGGGGGITSINGDTTAAQLIVGSSGISVNTASGTTTLALVAGGPYANRTLSNLDYTGANNIGYFPNVSIGHDNLSIGLMSSQNLNAGVFNTVYGISAGQFLSGNGNNTLIGYFAGFSLINSNGTTSIGGQSLYHLTTGDYNTALGFNAGLTYDGHTHSTFLGATSDASGASLDNATAIGWGSVVPASNTIQLGNTAVTDVYANGNVRYTGSLYFPTSTNTGVGNFYQNGVSVFSTFGNNTFLSNPGGPAGNYTLSSGTANIGIGNIALASIDTAYGNIGIGDDSGNDGVLASLSVGVGNIGIGGDPDDGCPMPQLNNASWNIGIGSNALGNLLTGNGNVGIGRLAGPSGGVTSCSNSFFLGFEAGDTRTSGTITNVTAIGNGAQTTTDNTIQLGNSSITGLFCSGTLHVGGIDSLSTQVLGTPGSGVATITNLPAGVSTTPKYLRLTINGTLSYIPFFQ